MRAFVVDGPGRSPYGVADGLAPPLGVIARMSPAVMEEVASGGRRGEDAPGRVEEGQVSEDNAILYHYEAARGHARAIVEAAGPSPRGGGCWEGRGIPVEAGAMTAAIALEMNFGAQAGQVNLPTSLIRWAVDDVLADPPSEA